MTLFKQIITSEPVEPMNCKEVRLFIPLFVLGGQGMTLDECIVLDDHIQSCPSCAQEYKETGFIIGLIGSNRTVLINENLFSESVMEDVGRKLTDDEILEEIWDKVERGKARKRHNRRIKQTKQLFKNLAAVLVCLIIGIFTWLKLPIHSKPQIFQKPSSQQVALTPKPLIKIELISKNGMIHIPATQPVVTKDELKKLVINNKHHITMNINTVLAIEPLVEKHHIGCLVKLASGQIFTNVEHDGNAFIVDTAHGQATITGTTFDVKVTDNSTTLVVSEGTVQFESKNCTVIVAAGQTSRILDQLAPSIPKSCNTATLTAWATGYKVESSLEQTKNYSSKFELPYPEKAAIVLEETDYDCWMKEKRRWFKVHFPWIFQLQNALAEQDIKVDYPKLLIQSSDVWQFAYMKNRYDRFSILRLDSLIKTASEYGFDKQWLLENISTAKYEIKNPPLSKNNLTHLNEFKQWSQSFDNMQKSPKAPNYDPLWHSFHASVYITETRSLIWFAVKNRKFDLTDKERKKVLALLQQEVEVACECGNSVINTYKEDNSKSPYGENECDRLIKHTIKLTSAIYEYEKTLIEYIPIVSEMLRQH